MARGMPGKPPPVPKSRTFVPSEPYGFGYGERMQYVVLVKVVYVLAGNDVYLAVPVFVQLVERGKPVLLLGGDVREIFQYAIHNLFL